MGRPVKYSRVSRMNELRVNFAAWCAHPDVDHSKADQVLLGSGDEVSLARFDLDTQVLSEPASILSNEEDLPLVVSVHPGGDGVIFAHSEGCKLYEWDRVANTKIKGKGRLDLQLNPGARVLPALKDIGPQRCVVFSGDGSLLGLAGEDGHLRVFEWPSMEIILDVTKAYMKPINDLDFSLDSAFISTTAEDSPCYVWDLSSSSLVATLSPGKGETFGFCRFSRDGMRPFLFISLSKGGKGLIGVWDISNWRKIGDKLFLDQLITALTITHHGKKLAIGGLGGDVSIIEVKKMEIQQKIEAHLDSVTLMDFSYNDKALLSRASDSSTQVLALDLSGDWKDWQLYALLIGLILLSAVIFYYLYHISDPFWNFPLGRNQPARPPIEAIYGYGNRRNSHSEL